MGLMVSDKKRVGRPEKTDSEGNPILTKVINVNVPIKLVEFLKEKGVNRSEMFTKVATWLHHDQICDTCFSKLESTGVGGYCQPCGTRYWTRTKSTKTFWKYFNLCPNCEESYNYENLFAQTKQGLDGCQKCGVI